MKVRLRDGRSITYHGGKRHPTLMDATFPGNVAATLIERKAPAPDPASGWTVDVLPAYDAVAWAAGEYDAYAAEFGHLCADAECDPFTRPRDEFAEACIGFGLDPDTTSVAMLANIANAIGDEDDEPAPDENPIAGGWGESFDPADVQWGFTLRTGIIGAPVGFGYSREEDAWT